MGHKQNPALLTPIKIPAWYRYVVKPLYLLLLPVMLLVKLSGLIPCGLSSFFDFLLNLGTDPNKPLSPIRFALYKFQKKILYRITSFLFGFVIIQKGKPIPNVRAVCYNHQTAVDILITAGTGAWSAVSKASILSNPFFGPTLRVTRSYLARKGEGNFDGLTTRLTEVPQRFPPLGVFPAGTTTNQKVFPRFRTGIFISKPDVQIASIQYRGYENIFYASGSGPAMIWNIIKNPMMFVHITYYPEIIKAQEKEDGRAYADRVGKLLADKVGGVYTNYGFKDMLWFNGNFNKKEELSSEYLQDQLWRGDYVEWAKKCKKVGLDPAYDWSPEQVGDELQVEKEKVMGK